MARQSHVALNLGCQCPLHFDFGCISPVDKQPYLVCLGIPKQFLPISQELCIKWKFRFLRSPRKAQTRLQGSSNRGGKEELSLREQDFLASWARPRRAGPHKAPFVEGPSSRADPSRENNRAMLRPACPACRAALRQRPKARKQGGAFL